MAKNRQSIVEVWRRASMLQRILLLSVVLACVGGGVLLVNWARRPQMCLLYSGLSPEEAAKIVEKIRDADVRYELRSGGTAIYVPEDQAYSLRLTMAAQGLPTGDQSGYRILDDEKIGASPFTQRVNYRRALEGELARTIQMLEGVVAARVHIASPEPSLFVGRRKDASATVALRLAAGHSLSRANVAAIVHLVAGSVEGLSAKNVVVVDSQGNLMSGEGDDELVKQTNNFLDYKTRVESYLSRKAEDMLTAVLGPNRASVRVHAVIETSSLDQTVETYDPEAKVVSKEEVTSKTPTGAGGDKASSGTREESTVSEFLVSRTLEQKRALPGTIKSLSVAALVDLSGDSPPAGGGQPAPKLSVQDVEEIVRRAIGVTASDTIKVVSTTFERPQAAAPAAGEAGFTNKDFYLEIAKRASLGILVFGALVALKMFGTSKRRAPAAAAQLPAEGELALEAQGGEGARRGLLPPAGSNPATGALAGRIARALEENPEEVKKLFLSWVESEKGEG